MGKGTVLRRYAATGLLLLGIYSLCSSTIAYVAFQQKSPTSTNSFKLSTTDVVGKFYSGDGLGRNEILLIEKDGSYDYKDHGCLGLYGSAKGSWRLDGDVIKFSNQNDGPRRLVPVKWGSRIYLFREQEMESQLDRLFERISYRPNDTHGTSYVKEPLPKLTRKDFVSEPVVPDRYLELWKKTKSKYKEDFKDLDELLDFQ